jgi:hypothetical protein
MPSFILRAGAWRGGARGRGRCAGKGSAGARWRQGRRGVMARPRAAAAAAAAQRRRSSWVTRARCARRRLHAPRARRGVCLFRVLSRADRNSLWHSASAPKKAPPAGPAGAAPRRRRRRAPRDASTVDAAMSVSATERAIMRLSLTQMLRRRMLYSTRVAASQTGCQWLPGWKRTETHATWPRDVLPHTAWLKGCAAQLQICGAWHSHAPCTILA